jgi:hypothetical protein
MGFSAAKIGRLHMNPDHFVYERAALLGVGVLFQCAGFLSMIFARRPWNFLALLVCVFMGVIFLNAALLWHAGFKY